MLPSRLTRLSALAALFILVGFSLAPAQPYTVSTVAGTPNESGHADATGAAARFNTPHGITIDAAENLYVADTLNHVIRKISPAGLVSTLAGTPGESGFVNASGSAARFFEPRTLLVDSTGALIVSDRNGVRHVTPDGLVSTIVQTFGSAPGIALDRTGNLIFTERFYDQNGHYRGHRLRRRAPNGTTSDVTAHPVGSLNAIATAHLAAGPDDTIYITDDSATAIQKLSPDGTLSILAGAPGVSGTQDGSGTDTRFTGPSGLAIDSAGNLFVTDAETTLRRITREGVVTTLVGQPGQKGYVDGISGVALFRSLGDVAPGPNLTFYLVDAGSHTVRKVIPATAPYPPIITTAPGSLSQNVSVGGNASFTVVATGAGLRYQWSKNDTPLSGATSATLSLTGVREADAGAYSVLVSTEAGSATLAAGMLNVHATTITSFTLRHTRPGAGMLWSIASGNGLLVAVGDGGTILTSSDGRSWTRRNSGTSDWLLAVTYGASQFVAVGDRGRILLSPDGLNWSPAPAPNTTQRINNVLHAANLFVAVGEGGTLLTSSDARTWTPRDSGVTGWLRGLAYNPAPIARNYTSYFAFPGTPTFLSSRPAMFSASGEGGILLTSVDGIGWQRSYGTPLDLEALVSVGGESNFVGIGQNGTALHLPQFGYVNSRIMPTGHYYVLSPQPQPTGATLRLRGLAQGASALFATGENGTILAAPGVSGPWTRVPSGTTANLVGGIFHGNSLYVVGAEETIVQSDPLLDSRLTNISTRGRVGTDASTLISGFVVAGAAPRQILIRAAGPALAGFGLADTVAAPILTVFDGGTRPLAANTRWSTAANASDISTTAARVGAFPFASDSADSALLLTLPPGAYTAQIAGAGDTTGLSLIEVYDASNLSSDSTSATTRLVNLSTRGHVGADAQRLIAGFVIHGPASRRVLIRAIGPTLAFFRVSGFLAQPELQLYNAQGALLSTAAAWSQRPDADEIRDAALIAGAFALPAENSDAAFVTTLLPGAYTVQVTGRNGTTGLALVEVYDLP